MKKFLWAMCSIALLLGLGSCKEEVTIQRGYNFVVSSFQTTTTSLSSLSEMAALDGFMKHNGFSEKNVLYTGDSDDNVNSQAVAEFDKRAARLETMLDDLKAELKKITPDGGTVTFEYEVVTGVSLNEDPSKGVLKTKSFEVKF